jgi:hypothetical protein
MERMSPEEIVKTVFKRVRTRDRSLSELFAADATLVAPGNRLEGREAIADFYEGVFRADRVVPEIEELFVSPPVVAALLRVTISDTEVLRVLDVFEIEDDTIRSMRVCSAMTSNRS